MNLQRILIPAALVGVAAAAVVLYLESDSNGRGVGRLRRRTPTMVRVTENGHKYHRDNCPLLHGASALIPVEEALGSYEPCKACHPPGT
jgi:hypothetical protein